MKWKKGIGIMVRCAAFVLVFSMFFSHTTNLLMRHDDESNEIHAFYGEPEDSIDVLCIGSSPLLRGVSPMVMWKEYGFTGYVRASALQAPAVSYGLLAESLQKQTPEVVVLLCDNIFLEYDYAEREGDLRRGLDGMKMSFHKLKIIQEITEADERQSALSYVFPLMRYHGRWTEVDLTKNEAEPLLEHSFRKGNVFLGYNAGLDYPEGFMQPTGKPAPSFNADAQAYTEKSIALCREKGIPVVLLHLPKMAWSYEESMAVEAFAEENGVVYLDLDREENRVQLGIVPQEDYYDQGHMNLRGCAKVSRWLGRWLDERYALPDHREDPAYAENWNADWAAYAAKAGLEEP